MKFYRLTPEKDRIESVLKDIGVDTYAVGMSLKGESLNILVKDVSSPAANIIKQEAIGSGMDAAVKRGVVSCSVEKSDVLLMGSFAHYRRLIKRLSIQVFGLKDLAKELENFILMKPVKNIICRDKTLSLEKCLVMGILNTTPDSFSDGNLYNTESKIVDRIEAIISEGADIIDIGGMSSRPYSESITAEEEIKRISFAVDNVLQCDRITVSVDTNNYKTAEYVLNKGVHIINDISGMEDDNMVRLCSEAGCGICIMHMKGTPENMQKDTTYNNILRDIKDFFDERIEKCLSFGIKEDRIMIDPGFCFGKTVEQNYALLKYLSEFKSFNKAILAGISRKSMIGAVTGREVNNRLSGTIACNTIAILNGADIIRVHDVKEGVDTVKTAAAVLKAHI